jgi:uncharacterized OsmC-like protein
MPLYTALPANATSAITGARFCGRRGKDLKDRLERVIRLDGVFSTEQRQSLLRIAGRCPVSKALRPRRS